MKTYSEIQNIVLNINGEERELVIQPSDTLLRVLREKLGLTGTRIGCEHGDCGACTVQINGKSIKSCLTLAIETIGDKITTIEGIDNDSLKRSFIEHHGFQCGYCTSGMIVNADSLLKANNSPSKEETRTYLESNLCRCTGYEGIETAVENAVKKREEK